MEKQPLSAKDDLKLILKVCYAGILGSLIGILLVQIGKEAGVIAPYDVFRMNDKVGIPAMTTSMIVATLALYYRDRKPTRV